MIIEYEIRDNIDNGRIFRTGMAPYYTSIHQDKLSALKEARKILLDKSVGKDKLYVTRSEYADQEKRNKDFCIVRSLVWSDWFHGIDMLEKMIKGMEK